MAGWRSQRVIVSEEMDVDEVNQSGLIPDWVLNASNSFPSSSTLNRVACTGKHPIRLPVTCLRGHVDAST